MNEKEVSEFEKECSISNAHYRAWKLYRSVGGVFDYDKWKKYMGYND